MFLLNGQMNGQSLKEALIEPVMLAYPQVDGGMFILDTDASGTAIGAVLSQVQNEEERVWLMEADA